MKFLKESLKENLRLSKNKIRCTTTYKNNCYFVLKQR